MIVISGRQFDLFSNEMESKFIVRVRHFLRRRLPDMVAHANDNVLDTFISTQVAAGLAAGVRTQRGLVYWALLALLTNGQFQEKPEFVAMLEVSGDSDYALTHLMDRLKRLTALA